MKKITPPRNNKSSHAVAVVTASEKLIESSHLSRPFPIVGIGASAGGLEALEEFLAHVPKDSGFGYVVVQHMDPTRKGMLVELLQRKTLMPVVQVKDRMKIEPDHVYVIPPNTDLSILRGVLHLLEPSAPRGLRLPIDFFFRSLAADRQEQSIGVILSGMGADGTGGVGAIKEIAGAVFVQTPTSAKFESMPRMAIEAGWADVIAPACELPGKIIEYFQYIPRLVRPNQDIAEKDQSAMDKVVILLRAQTGHDFSLYKKSTIGRRIERRMGLHQITKSADYLRYLRENTSESELLFKEMLIGVTNFFRDPAVWEQLRDSVMPKFLATRPPGAPLRAWIAGCSTGEEAYSLAITFKEVMEHMKPSRPFSLQIFATDLDKDAIDKARSGVYSDCITANVADERLQRFFVKNEQGGFIVKKEIREMVTFAPHNLVMHPPFTRLDFVTCRNVLIYFDAELQKKMIPLFHYSLKPGGLLLLGSAETVGSATNLFTPVDGKSRLYRRVDTSRHTSLDDFPSSFTRYQPEENTSAFRSGATAPAPNLQSLADRLLLQRYSPAAVVVTKDGDILYVSGKTGRYLEPAAGKANWNIFAMAREGLSNALHETFHRCVRRKTVGTLSDVKVGTNGSSQVVNITVQPLTGPDALEGLVMVIFTNVSKTSALIRLKSSRRDKPNSHLAEITKELQQAHEELQTLQGDMQSSQEELKSTNEELQSMNEELQSTNEELTTSKEEMQSMNEELQTVNHELQAKVEELSNTSSDMKNLLESTDIATLFLDKKLLIRRFTKPTASIIKLIPGDVGRPITDIVTTLEYSDLAADCDEVVKTQLPFEKQVASSDGHWFTVRIMPYRTQDNRTDGAVITFTNVTVAKNLEVDLRKAQLELEGRFSDQATELDKSRRNLRTQINLRKKPTQRKESPPVTETLSKSK